MRMSLEEERRALLEQIEARRNLYRRMLSGDSEDRQTTGVHRQAIGHAISPQHNRLGHWLLDHPCYNSEGPQSPGSRRALVSIPTWMI